MVFVLMNDSVRHELKSSCNERVKPRVRTCDKNLNLDHSAMAQQHVYTDVYVFFISSYRLNLQASPHCVHVLYFSKNSYFAGVKLCP